MIKNLLAWCLWLWIALVIAGAYLWAPDPVGFQVPGSGRTVFFHVPMAWTAFVGFMAAGVWSALYLARGRQVRHDHSAQVAVHLGLVFCVLATVTGAMWARVEWNDFWNWDPRQISIAATLLFYLAYTALRSSISDPQTERRLAAAYAVLGLALTPFFMFVMPRISGFSLHPNEAVINAEGEPQMRGAIRIVLLAGALAFTALFFWIHNLGRRLQTLKAQADARALEEEDHGRP